MAQADTPIDEILFRALKIESEADRAEYLNEVCGTDADLRARVEKLLGAYPEAGSFLDSPAVPAAPTIDLPITVKPGTQIGPYKLLQQLGEGGMGVVYMAEQKEPVKRRVALKIIKPGMDTRQVIARFEAERQALAMMDHPNIAKVLDAGATESGRPYFVMELVNGISVTKYCDEQHLTTKERLELFVPICQAVQHAHQKGIIHRDLKPSNIMVALYDGQPVPKVIDFGVAKATSQTLTDKTMFTQLGQIVGTLEYVSPEQAQRNQLDIDTRSDIYSLGVVLYELLTGEPPFDSKRLRSAAFDEMLRILREEEPSRPSTKVSSSLSLPSIAANRRIEPARLANLIQGELDWIVLKAMEKERARRYQTAAGFAEDIQRYLRDEVVTARPRSKAYLFRKFAKRNRVAIAMGTSIAASLIIGSGLAWWQSYLATLDRDRAVAAEQLADQRLGVVLQQRDEIAAEQTKAKLESERAQRQAAIALAVNEFLCTDLLGMADTDQQVRAEINPNPDIRLRTLLDRASQNVELTFADQPAVEAWIHRTLALSYLAVGAPDLAKRHALKAVELNSKTFGVDHANTIDSKYHLARVSDELGEHAEANKLFREVLEIRRGLYGGQDERTLLVVKALSGTYMKQSRLLAAEELCEQAIEAYRGKFGAEHPRTLREMINLANLRGSQARFAEAEELFRLAYKGHAAENSEDSISGIRCRVGVARSLAAQGRQAEGEVILREVVDRLKEIRGISHPETLLRAKQLALMINSQGRHEDAEQLLLDFENSLSNTAGIEHSSRLTIKECLAELYEAQGQWRKAEQLFREILDLRRSTLGEQHLATLDSQLKLGSILDEQGRHVEAEPLMRDALDSFHHAVGEEHPRTLGCSNQLAVSLIRQQRFSEAKELLGNSLPISKKVVGPEHPDTLSTLHNYAIANRMTGGQIEEFRQINADILRTRQRILGDNHPDTLNSMQNLANVEAELKHNEEAERLLRQLVAIRHQTQGENHPLTLHAQMSLAKAYFDQRKYEKARDLYQASLASHRSTLGAAHPSTLSVMDDLILSLYQTRQFPQAVRIAMEMLATRRQSLGDEHASTKHSFRTLLELLRLTEINGSVLSEAEIDSAELIRLMEAAECHLPPDVDPALGLGWLYYRNGQYEQAIEMLEKSNRFRDDGGSEYQFYFLAMAHWQLGQKETARAWLEKADAKQSRLESASPKLAMLREEVTQLISTAKNTINSP